MNTAIFYPNEFCSQFPASSSAIIFGGTFDPIHEGHVQDIRRLLDLASTVLVAPTSQNPWKNDKPTTLAHRLEMIRMVLQHEGIEWSENIKQNGLVLLSTPYKFASELLTEVKNQRTQISPKEKFFWAIGEDLRESAPNWKDWNKKGVPFIALPLLEGISATKVRNKSSSAHPAIKSYIAQNSLYLD